MIWMTTKWTKSTTSKSKTPTLQMTSLVAKMILMWMRKLSERRLSVKTWSKNNKINWTKQMRKWEKVSKVSSSRKKRALLTKLMLLNLRRFTVMELTTLRRLPKRTGSRKSWSREVNGSISNTKKR